MYLISSLVIPFLMVTRGNKGIIMQKKMNKTALHNSTCISVGHVATKTERRRDNKYFWTSAGPTSPQEPKRAPNINN
jgi:hypothetical protein